MGGIVGFGFGVVGWVGWKGLGLEIEVLEVITYHSPSFGRSFDCTCVAESQMCIMHIFYLHCIVGEILSQLISQALCKQIQHFQG